MREKAGIAGNADHTERKIDVHPNQATANDEVTENVPRLRACAVTKSLKRGTNSGHLEVIGKKLTEGQDMVSRYLVSINLLATGVRANGLSKD